MKRLIDYTQGQSTLYSVALTGRLNFDINTATEWLTVLMLDAAADAINKKRQYAAKNGKPWMTSELRRQMRKRDRLFRQAQRAQKTKGTPRMLTCNRLEGAGRGERNRSPLVFLK